MSSDQLRRELDRIADSAPVVDLQDGTWARARRAAVLDRFAMGGAVLAVVAAVTAGVTWLPEQLDPPVADNPSLGVPDHLYPVPMRMSDRNTDDVDDAWTRDEVSTDLRIGVSAAAWLAHDLPVVVDADDGDYHLLNLPGYGGNNFFNQLEPPTIALSPDGTRLAYSWATFGPDADRKPIPSGVRVADLKTGEVAEYEIEGLEGTAVTNLAWSPSGTWVAFVGMQMDSWTMQSSSSGGAVAGRIKLADGRVDVLPKVRFNDASVGVDDDGLVAVGTDGFLRYWDGRILTDAPTATTMDSRLIASRTGVWALPSRGNVGIIDGKDVRDIRLSNGGLTHRPLGWVGSDIVVAADEDSGIDTVGDYIELVPVGGGARRKVADLEGVDVHSLTMAVDLMASHPPTVSRPEPEWPWSEERWSLTIGLGVAGVLSVLWLVRRGWRRYAPRWGRLSSGPPG